MSEIAFYDTYAWRVKRAKILECDHYECQECKRHGKYAPATIVHHVRHLEDYPEFALCDYYTDNQGVEHRQLISVCKNCHETVCHPERLHSAKKLPPLTEERWD